MSGALEQLVDSLLYEGYALYPYTPGATKNATPTPFGIVYPAAYAARLDTTFDHLRLECLAEIAVCGSLIAEVRFLAASGVRHQAEAQRAELPAVGAPGGEASQEFEFGDLALRMSVASTAAGDGRVKIVLLVENVTDAPADLDRSEALGRSLISTHPILRLSGGRFVSPLESGQHCDSVNTWPVLASPDDDVMLGAAIVLPDHPSLAPESLGNLFDSTEIEEALLLHVQALSDEERAEIERQDPRVKEMVERAAATTPEDLLKLHGRVTLTPPTPSAAVRDPSAGEASAEVDGKRFRRGGKVLLRPGPDADLHARMLAGHTATVERIYTDFDGKVHLGVTVDDDPGQELMRETGRFLFFFAPEVEVIS
ncbi:MAG TPA: hypothetical protein VH817_15980 [Thermoleophilaceae bacterium]|jgi:hypothetical protein